MGDPGSPDSAGLLLLCLPGAQLCPRGRQGMSFYKQAVGESSRAAAAGREEMAGQQRGLRRSPGRTTDGPRAAFPLGGPFPFFLFFKDKECRATAASCLSFCGPGVEGRGHFAL